MEIQVLLLLLCLIAVVAAAVGIVWFRPKVSNHHVKERFSPRRSEILTPMGDSMVDDACGADIVNGGRFVMRGYPYMTKHPSANNLCIFMQNQYDDTVMDSQLNQCKRSAPFFDDAKTVTGVSVQQIDGLDRCVVEMTPNKSIDDYMAYEKKARDETLMKTKLYLALKAKYDALMAKFIILTEEVRVLEVELKKVQDDRAELKIKQKQAEDDTVLANGQLQAKKGTIYEMSGQLVNLESKAVSAEQTQKATEAKATEAIAESKKVVTLPPPPPPPPQLPACNYMWADQRSFEIKTATTWRTDFPDKGAKWIWNIPNAGSDAPASTVVFQKSLHLPNSTDASLYVIVDDYSLVYMNNTLLGKTSGGFWKNDPWQVFRVSLHAGTSVVTIVGTNAPLSSANPAGLKASLIDRHGQPLVHTDSSWLWTMHMKAPGCASFDLPPDKSTDGGSRHRLLRAGHAPNLCLDVSEWSKATGAQVYMFRCHGDSNQKWKLDGKNLVNANSGKCLNVWENKSQPGAALKQYPCDGGANSSWSHVDGSLRPDHAPNMCLDVKGAGTNDRTEAILWPCHGGANQKFQFA
eukprot:gene17741-24101_t